jgi:hypothetical protein
METVTNVMEQTHALPDLREKDPGRGSVRFGYRSSLDESSAKTVAFLESMCH